MGQLRYEFDAEIRRLEGKIKWDVVYFPYAANEEFGTNGRVAVVVTVDGYEFDQTLLPSRNGHYFVINKATSRKIGKERGDTVAVTVRKDDKKREIEVPDLLKKALSQSNTLETFLRQPYFFRRERITHILAAKKDETKTARIEKLVEWLDDRT